MKIQTKIALLFTVLCTAVIVALSFSVYFFTYENAAQDFYTRLQLRALIAAKANLDDNADTTTFASIRREHLRRLPDEREYILDTDTLHQVNIFRLSKGESSLFFKSIAAQGESFYRNDYDFYYGMHYRKENKTYIIIITAENTFLKVFLNNLKKILTASCVVCVLVVFSIGLLFSKQILAPIRHLSKQVQLITATSLHRRLPIEKGKDEIAMLSNTFNNMLSRLETSFETQNNFVSNASHELNTPLTAIIGEADFALSKLRTEEQYRQSLTVISQQGEKLQRITQSLVQLARSGFKENLATELVNINELLYNVKHNVHQVYSNSVININTSLAPDNKNELLVTGNPQLLELALSNILLNACKYSNFQPVSVALALSSTHVVIVVKDNGIGIPEEEVKDIFIPFFRASNVKNIDGYGIGLPLTQNIIRQHKGTIDIQTAENAGTEVVVSLPRA